MNKEAEQWKHEYEVLDACLELAQGKIAELKAENDRLKELKCKFKEEYCTCNTEKYVKCLQEIKEICDYENEYNSIGINDYKSMIKDIVNLITKAEEE